MKYFKTLLALLVLFPSATYAVDKPQPPVSQPVFEDVGTPEAFSTIMSEVDLVSIEFPKELRTGQLSGIKVKFNREKISKVFRNEITFVGPLQPQTWPGNSTLAIVPIKPGEYTFIVNTKYKVTDGEDSYNDADIFVKQIIVTGSAPGPDEPDDPVEPDDPEEIDPKAPSPGYKDFSKLVFDEGVLIRKSKVLDDAKARKLLVSLAENYEGAVAQLAATPATWQEATKALTANNQALLGEDLSTFRPISKAITKQLQTYADPTTMSKAEMQKVWTNVVVGLKASAK